MELPPRPRAATRVIVHGLARGPRAGGGPALDLRRRPSGNGSATRRSGDFDNLMIAHIGPVSARRTGMHYAEAWSERVCDGAWGRLAARWARSFAAPLDLDHWAAFHVSFDRVARLLARGRDAASRARRRDRSSSSRATSTTPTSARSASRAARASRATSTRRSARRSATRSTPRAAQVSRRFARRVWALHPGAGSRARRRRRPRDPVALPRGPLLRQPGREHHARRARCDDEAREDGGGPRERRAQPRARASSAT